MFSKHLVVCLLASAACRVLGSSLRNPTPGYVDPAIDALEATNAEQVVAGLYEKTGAAVSSAQASASRATSALLSAEDLSTKGQTKMAQLKEMLRGATVAGENSATASEQATGSLNFMKTFAAKAVEDSKGLAVQAVQQMFEAKYHELDSWRQAVLTDPYQNAQSARAAALKANDNTLHELYNRISIYQPGIQPMQTEAKNLIGSAGKLAQDAKAKYRYDPYGALQDISNAKSMQAQGGELAKTAEALHASVANMNTQIQATLDARNPSVLAAEQWANPNSMPPLPVNPNFAYAPMLPPR